MGNCKLKACLVSLWLSRSAPSHYRYTTLITGEVGEACTWAWPLEVQASEISTQLNCGLIDK